MTKSSFGPILENFNLEDLSLAFFKILEIFLRSDILAELFFFDIASAVKLRSGCVLFASQLSLPVIFLYSCISAFLRSSFLVDNEEIDVSVVTRDEIEESTYEENKEETNVMDKDEEEENDD